MERDQANVWHSLPQLGPRHQRQFVSRSEVAGPHTYQGGEVNRGIIGAVIGVLIIIILVIVILQMT
jgi:tetrahydromethanopterin S-methyltransferase subunit F